MISAVKRTSHPSQIYQLISCNWAVKVSMVKVKQGHDDMIQHDHQY